jgi:hypothetical protein
MYVCMYKCGLYDDITLVNILPLPLSGQVRLDCFLLRGDRCRGRKGIATEAADDATCMYVCMYLQYIIMSG